MNLLIKKICLTEQADAGAASSPTYHGNERNLKSQAFIPGDDPIVNGKAWDNWLEEIKEEFRYFKITEPLNKKDALIM